MNEMRRRMSEVVKESHAVSLDIGSLLGHVELVKRFGTLEVRKYRDDAPTWVCISREKS